MNQELNSFFGAIFICINFKKGKKYLLRHLDNNNIVKKVNKYYKYSSKYIYKGEGGLSYFGIYFEGEYNNNNNYLYDNKDSNNNNYYFIIFRKKHYDLHYIKLCETD